MRYTSAKEKLLQELLELTDKYGAGDVADAFAQYRQVKRTYVQSADKKNAPKGAEK